MKDEFLKLKMRFLLTGSPGNIGLKVAKIVTQYGVCIGVDLVPGRFTTHLGSITNKSFMNEDVSGVDAIIHTAAYLTPFQKVALYLLN